MMVTTSTTSREATSAEVAVGMEIIYVVTAPAGASPGKVAVLREAEFDWGLVRDGRHTAVVVLLFATNLTDEWVSERSDRLHACV